jgi:hypothetical protein
VSDSYLRLEWEARKGPALDALLAERLASAAGEGAGEVDEVKVRKGVAVRVKKLFDQIPVIKCTVCDGCPVCT